MKKSTKKIKPPESARKLAPVQYALVDMRRVLGLTQSELAKRVGMAVITLAKLETSRIPSGQSLVKLRDFAHANNLPSHASAFEFVLRQSVLADPQMQTISYGNRAEMEAMLAARHMVRTNQTYEQALSDVRSLLAEFRHDPERLFAIELLDHVVGPSRTDRPERLLKVLTDLNRKIEEKKHE
ncbi:MAG: helix-turn-helix transcriptional regulator [Bryobacteraceae bacterium]